MAVAAEKIPEISAHATIREGSRVYPERGVAYWRSGAEIDYSPRLVCTGKNFYDSLRVLRGMAEAGMLPEDTRFWTQAEAYAREQDYIRQGKDLRKEEEFADYFANNREKRYIWEYTLTGLRVPKGLDASRYETDSKGNKFWRRIVLIRDEEAGEHLVPEGNNRVIVESEDVFGLPLATREIEWPHEGHHAHFLFNAEPPLDKISGHYDLAVRRGGGWLLGGHLRCVGLDAGRRRSVADAYDGFRLVQGSLPEIKKIASGMDEEAIRRQALERAREEVARDLQQLLEKYT